MKYDHTTPVPNRLFSEYLTILSSVELRALLWIIRSTLGWKDPQTGQRKQRDWISNSQFSKRAGISERSVSTALQGLIDKQIIQATDGAGRVLHSPQERKFTNRVFYQLCEDNSETIANKKAHSPQSTANFSENRPQDLRSTKETLLQKVRTGQILPRDEHEQLVSLLREEEQKQKERDRWRR